MAEESGPQGTTPSAPLQTPPAAAAAPPAEDTAPKEVKIKVRKPKQRSCDEKDAKGKLCELESKIGKDAEIYRCEFCKTLYKPDPKQMPHSYTLRY